MSPKKITKPLKVSVFLPADLHAKVLEMADGRSLSSWIATQLAKLAGMSKGYKPPRAGRPKKPVK